MKSFQKKNKRRDSGYGYGSGSFEDLSTLEGVNVALKAIMRKRFVDKQLFTVFKRDQLDKTFSDLNQKILNSNVHYFACVNENENFLNFVLCILNISNHLLCLFVDSKNKGIPKPVLKIFFEYHKKNEGNLFLIHALEQMMINLDSESVNREKFIKIFDDPLQSPIKLNFQRKVEYKKSLRLYVKNLNIDTHAWMADG